MRVVIDGTGSDDTPKLLWCNVETRNLRYEGGPTKDQLRRGSAPDECVIHRVLAGTRPDCAVCVELAARRARAARYPQRQPGSDAVQAGGPGTALVSRRHPSQAVDGR